MCPQVPWGSQGCSELTLALGILLVAGEGTGDVVVRGGGAQGAALWGWE